MGTIYNPPKGFNPPDIRKFSGNIDAYFKACDQYVERIKQAIRNSYRAVCPEAGEELAFPQGDGHARYIIARLKPVELIHLDIGDQWHYPYVHRLTAADIRAELKRAQGLKKLFGSLPRAKPRKEKIPV